MIGVSPRAQAGKHHDPNRSALKQRVAENVLDRIERGALPLPSIPLAALACFELLRKPDFSMQEAARVIEQDPALALRVLSVSHSVAFRAKKQARSIIHAITQLGAENLRLVLFEAMAAPIYESSDRRIRKACRVLWRHSRAVASAARLAASQMRALDPGEPYLAGLLHDVGKPMVASLLLRAEHRLIGKQTDLWLEPDAWLDVVQDIHRTVGVALVQKWELAEPIVRCVAFASTPQIVSHGSIVDCVGLANALAKQVGVYTGHFDPAAVENAVHEWSAELGLGHEDIEALRIDLKRFGGDD
jgi:HD-like signal output (HDOD) protein